ncbi:MAG: HAAS signaling domain-containing protein [bacterium]
MKKYIERYIYDVTRRLPKEIQEEVKNELEANIYDMLPEKPTDEDINRVLHELGSPRKIANNYKDRKEYVISPLYYDDYIRVLKLVAIIVGSIALFFAAVDIVINMDEPNILASLGYIFSRLIGNTINSLIWVFFIVTIIFWIIDHENVNNKDTEWKLKDLPDLPSPATTKISKAGAIVSLIFYSIFSLIFIIILLEYVPIIGYYENGELIAPFFNQTVTDKFIIPFIISAIIGFGVHLLQVYEGEWKLNVAIYYTISTFISVSIGLTFINQANLITHGFISSMAALFDLSFAKFQSGIETGKTVITVIVVIVTIIDLISIWFKTLKPKQTKI